MSKSGHLTEFFFLQLSFISSLHFFGNSILSNVSFAIMALLLIVLILSFEGKNISWIVSLVLYLELF